MQQEKGKAEGVKMEKAQKELSTKMYKYVNKKHPATTCDLHGQQVKYALEIVDDFVKKNKGNKEVIIIYGAGNHSGKGMYVCVCVCVCMNFYVNEFSLI